MRLEEMRKKLPPLTHTVSNDSKNGEKMANEKRK